MKRRIAKRRDETRNTVRFVKPLILRKEKQKKIVQMSLYVVDCNVYNKIERPVIENRIDGRTDNKKTNETSIR